MGGSFMQKANGEKMPRAIGYAQKAFNMTKRKYSAIEREMATLRFCVKAFTQFLYRVKSRVRTDHEPLVYLDRMKRVDGRITRTIGGLSDFNFVVIKYTPGSSAASFMIHVTPSMK